MRIHTIQEIEELLGVTFETLRTFREWPNSATFLLRTDPGALTALSRELSFHLSMDAGSVLIVENTGVWPSCENMHLVERFRHAFGEHRSVQEAPAHVFTKDEHSDCWSAVLLCFLNFWEFIFLSADRKSLIYGSNDECMDIYTLHQEDMKQLRSIVQRFELKELQAKTDSDDQEIERQYALLEKLRQERNSNSQDIGAQERLAKGLCEAILDLAETEENRFLQELRLLVRAHPESSLIRECLSRALSGMIYYASQEGEFDRRDLLLGELRQLVRAYPNDGVARGLLGKNLFSALSAAKAVQDVNGYDSLRQELEKLVHSYPEDSELQQWLTNAEAIESPHT
jgi:hypothetical protein